MEYITDLDEIFRLLSKCCGEPVYKTIAIDEEGNEVAVPMFSIGAADEKYRKDKSEKVINYADFQNKRKTLKPFPERCANTGTGRLDRREKDELIR